MSSIENIVDSGTNKRAMPWSLWARQVRAIFRLEIEKNFLRKRSVLIYLKNE